MDIFSQKGKSRCNINFADIIYFYMFAKNILQK